MSTESLLDQLFEEWKELVERGQYVPAEELCVNCPELKEELDKRIKQVDFVEQVTIANEKPAISTCAPQNRDLEASSGLLMRQNYANLRFLAKGGLGEVFVAQDKVLNREVVLKFIRKRYAQAPMSRVQFEVETEVTAQLDHPGVVPVYGFGETADRRLFYAMRFIQGDTLEETIERYHTRRGDDADSSRQHVEFRSLLDHFVSVCKTIAYAHNRGILHRDIKPKNIMLGRYGESLVVDWGLALPIQRDEVARSSGEMTLMPSASGSGSSMGTSAGGVGTPAFMSPEQASGNQSLSTSSDIFSLGATLYKILTGKNPYDGKNAMELIEKARQADFEPPGKLNREISSALEAICLKAMAYHPPDRYKTAMDLANDLEHWLADEPVVAYNEGLSERIGRWTRRHRIWTQATATTLLVTVVVISFAAISQNRLAHSERTARISAQRAHEQGIRIAAMFAAKTVAGEIDRRWRILEAEAADPVVRDLIQVATEQEPGHVSWKDLLLWLNERHLNYTDSARATSWFITDHQGRQLSRSPKAATIGKNYSFRDYFHGLGRDFDAKSFEQHQPIRGPHRSLIFRSKANGNLMVAFSVPIWSLPSSESERSVLGILAMTVEVGQFGVLQIGLGNDQVAVLVDSKPDWEGRKGLILQHPLLAEQRLTGGSSTHTSPSLFVTETERLAAFEELRVLRLTENHPRQSASLAEHQAELERLNLDREYVDPVGGDFSGNWLAAFEPILITGRSQDTRDTGWLVIVQERPVKH